MVILPPFGLRRKMGHELEMKMLRRKLENGVEAKNLGEWCESLYGFNFFLIYSICMT